MPTHDSVDLRTAYPFAGRLSLEEKLPAPYDDAGGILRIPLRHPLGEVIEGAELRFVDPPGLAALRRATRVVGTGAAIGDAIPHAADFQEHFAGGIAVDVIPTVDHAQIAVTA